jgi:hypothetical protein
VQSVFHNSMSRLAWVLENVELYWHLDIMADIAFLFYHSPQIWSMGGTNAGPSWSGSEKPLVHWMTPTRPSPDQWTAKHSSSGRFDGRGHWILRNWDELRNRISQQFTDVNLHFVVSCNSRRNMFRNCDD